MRCEEGVSRKEDKSYYYHCDYPSTMLRASLGSPRVMTDQLGNVIWRQDYYAFGGDYGTTAGGNSHKFTGHVKDDATGQYYAKARYFTTSLGRFSQPDPALDGVPGLSIIRNPQELNPYTYCYNRPTSLVDPDGEAGIPALALGAGFLIGGGVGATMEMMYNGGNNMLNAGIRGFLAGGASTDLYMVTLARTGNPAAAGAAGGATYEAVSGALSGQSIGNICVNVLEGAGLGALTAGLGLAKPRGGKVNIFKSRTIKELLSQSKVKWTVKNAGYSTMLSTFAGGPINLNNIQSSGDGYAEGSAPAGAPADATGGKWQIVQGQRARWSKERGWEFKN